MARFATLPMRRLTWAAVASGLALIIAPVAGQANTLWEVESARGNARAGGPTNAFDADLLERYGALSGTPVRDWRTGRIVRDSRQYTSRRDRRRHGHD
jgi:hypothetical protein